MPLAASSQALEWPQHLTAFQESSPCPRPQPGGHTTGRPRGCTPGSRRPIPRPRGPVRPCPPGRGDAGPGNPPRPDQEPGEDPPSHGPGPGRTCHPRGRRPAQDPGPAGPEDTDLVCAASPPSRRPRRSWRPAPAGWHGPAPAHTLLSAGSSEPSCRQRPLKEAKGCVTLCWAQGHASDPEVSPGGPGSWSLSLAARSHATCPLSLQSHSLMQSLTLLPGPRVPAPCHHPSQTPQALRAQCPPPQPHSHLPDLCAGHPPTPQSPFWQIPASLTFSPSRGRLFQGAPLTSWAHTTRPPRPGEGAWFSLSMVLPPGTGEAFRHEEGKARSAGGWCK